MSYARRDQSGVLRQIAVRTRRDADNVLRTIKVRTRRGADNVLRVIYSALSAITSTDTVAGIVNKPSAHAVTTDSVTASPVDGAGAVTYSWAQVGASDWTINSPAAATTTFTSPPVDPYDFLTTAFICTITASGASADTPPVTANASNIGGGGFIA